MNLKKQIKNKLADMKDFPSKLSVLFRFKFINSSNLCFKYLTRVIFKEMQIFVIPEKPEGRENWPAETAIFSSIT